MRAASTARPATPFEGSFSNRSAARLRPPPAATRGPSQPGRDLLPAGWSRAPGDRRPERLQTASSASRSSSASTSSSRRVGGRPAASSSSACAARSSRPRALRSPAEATRASSVVARPSCDLESRSRWGPMQGRPRARSRRRCRGSGCRAAPRRPSSAGGRRRLGSAARSAGSGEVGRGEDAAEPRLEAARPSRRARAGAPSRDSASSVPGLEPAPARRAQQLALLRQRPPVARESVERGRDARRPARGR